MIRRPRRGCTARHVIDRPPGRYGVRATTLRMLVGGAAALLSLSLSACSAIGPRQVPIDRFDYNSAVATSANEQMLLNLVRLRYSEVPVFLAVNSVLTQYVWTGELGLLGTVGENAGETPIESSWIATGTANLRYLERPTVTYTPLSGQEFAVQLTSPVRPELVFSLVSSGWPPSELLFMTLQRFNDVENLGVVSDAPGARQPSRDFSRVVELIIELARRNAIELTRAPTQTADEVYLEFSQAADAETQALIGEFKSLTGMDHGISRYRVIKKIIGRSPDEVTIRMHSMLELMGLLSAGVDATPEDLGVDRAAQPSFDGEAMVPLRVSSQRHRPRDPFVAVRYGEKWYYIQRSDNASKRAFGLLIYLFQMQASQAQGAGPLLTVPIG